MIGAIVVDEFMTVTELPTPEQSASAESYSRATGGKAANQAAAASLFSGRAVPLIAVVGQDSHGDTALAEIAATGVDTSACLRDELPTGRSFILVDSHGVQILATWPGASSALSQSNARDFVNRLPSQSWISLQGETPDTAACARIARAVGHKIILNPSPVDQFQSAFPWDLVDIVVVNKFEADALASELTQVDTVITTQGPEGVLVRHGGSVVHMTAPPVAVVDTTGAGDAFAGVMSIQLAAGDDIHAAVRAGVAAATVSVTREQCIPSYPTRMQTEALVPSISESRL